MATSKTTTVHHLVDQRFVGITPDGMQVMIDGQDDPRTGMSPMDLLLNAVGACAAFDVAEMIRKRRLDLRSYRVELEGDRADGTPAFFTAIRARHVIDAPGLKQAMAERFVDLATNTYCSVGASIRAEVDVEVELLHELDGGGEG